jgi:hypothetical protein
LSFDPDTTSGGATGRTARRNITMPTIGTIRGRAGQPRVHRAGGLLDVERKFRETRMYKVAPVNNNLVTSYVATKVLGLPPSY